MRVAIDLRPLQIGHQNRGIGAYLLNLLQYLPNDPDTDYIFLRYDVSDPFKDFAIPAPDHYREVVLKKYNFSKQPAQLIKYAWASLVPRYGKLMRYRPQVFFQTDYLLGAPRSWRCRNVVVAHDLIPFRFRALYLPSWRKYFHYGQHSLKRRLRLMLRAWFYQKKYQHAVHLLRSASVIISVSQSTTDDLVDILKLKKNRIHTVHSAASFRSNAQEDELRPSVKDAIDAIPRPYVTYLGGTDKRRQVDELIFAFNLYNSRGCEVDLVLCGNEFEADSKEIAYRVKTAIEQTSFKSRLHTFGRITEAEKKYILSHAAAFVYPTLYEGFGLPLLEAMQCGIPIISYKNSSIPEIAGDLPLYTNGTGDYAIFRALSELFENSKKWQKAGKAGIERASTFSWEQTAAATWELVLTKQS